MGVSPNGGKMEPKNRIIEASILEKMHRGAAIVINHWLRLKPWEKLLIVTSDEYAKEAELMRFYAKKRRAATDLMIVEKKGIKVGMYFDENETIFDGYKAIIGATDYSLVTTLAAKRAIARGSKYLSLPLKTNNGISMLAYDFMTMDTKKSKMMSKIIMGYLNSSEEIRVETDKGTKLTFRKENRDAGFFNGVVKDGNGYSSASIEVYIPIEETKTSGKMILDGSLGYIGKTQQDTVLEFKDGRLVYIEDNPTGNKLREYMEGFKDERIYIAAELGIGLNSISKCVGNAYIEDESAYGTFHIGFGRNLALGGVQEATGHFDIVSHCPTIYADNRMLMEKGRIILPTPVAY